MKIHKKLGLCLVLLATAIVALLLSPKAFASTITGNDFTTFPYEVTGFSHDNKDPTLNGKVDTLKVTIKTDLPTFPGNDYFFIDTNTNDDTDRLEYYGTGGVLCQMEKGQGGDLFGIKITDDPIRDSNGKDYFPAIIGIGYSGDTTKPCSERGADQFIQRPGASIRVFYSSSLQGAPVPTTICSPDSTDPKCTLPPPGGAGTCSDGIQNGDETSVDTGGRCDGGGGGATGTNDACYKSGWELSWAACPIITAAQTTANAMYGFVEDQLKFTVRDSVQTTDSLGAEHDSVKSAWNNFRILVSALAVILMLVMVISQAIGAGPFDAYAIKKMLPRLVIGVILIQLSWPIFSWVINTVDDLGRGLADIMYAPFGGSDALNLNSIMKPFTEEEIIFSWVGVPALAIFGVVAPFVVLGLILTVLVAIFVAFLTLLLRKIIIILCLIFVPVALIAWIVPGSQKYWKLWWDNFIKALMMFPLIVAMIAAGRIFAKIGSSQGDFVGFFIVLIGFFGPLFVLPKTFKWGGQAMQAAGGAMQKAQTATLKKPKAFLGERQKSHREEQRLKSKERVAAGEGFKWRKAKSYYRAPLDKVLSGQWDPTIWGRRAERTLATYKKTGRDAYTEDLGAARIGQQIDWEHLQEGGWVYADDGVTKIAKRGAKDDYLQDVLEGKHTEYIDESGKNWGKFVYSTDDGRTLDPLGKTRMEKLAALYEMEKLGGATNNRHILRYWEKVQNEAKSNPEAYSDFRRFMSDSVGTMLPKLTDMYKGLDSTADAGPTGVAAQHGTEVENMLARLTYNIKAAAPGSTVRANAEKMLRTYVSSYLSAAKNDNLRGGMEMGGKRVIKALVTTDTAARDDILEKIHDDPEDGRRTLGFEHWEIQTGSDIRDALGADLADELDRIIKNDGNFDEVAIKTPVSEKDETEIHIERDEI